MDAGRPIRVEFLVRMEGHSDTDCDLSQDVYDDLPNMYSSESDEDGDEPDPRSRLQYQVNIDGPNCKKKRVSLRKIGLRSIRKVNYAVIQMNPNHEKWRAMLK